MCRVFASGLLLVLLAGCIRPEPGPDPTGSSHVDPAELQTRADLSSIIHQYGVAQTPDEVRKLLPQLDRIASTSPYFDLAARARFAIGHACAYELHDDDEAVQQFRQVIELAPASNLTQLAEEQIEVIGQRRKEQVP